MDVIEERLLQEVDKANRYKNVWDEYLQPFFEQKEKDLFAAFKTISCHEPDTLMLCRMQCDALLSLRNEFETHINNGLIASQELKGK